MDYRNFATFIVSGRRMALPTDCIRRIVPLPLLQPAAGAPPYVEGFFDFRGEAVTAVRLDRLLHLGEDQFGVYSPLLLLKRKDPPVALHVARVIAVRTLAEADIRPIGRDETFNACVTGRIGEGGETVYLLSEDAILLTEERARIAAYHAIRKDRLEAVMAGDGGDAVHAV